jgi:hypothetical protein
MSTQHVHVRFSGKTKKLEIRTEGFVGEACTHVTKPVLDSLRGRVESEVRTPEADLEPVCVSAEQQEELVS